ncbi:hypothetical protein [Tissierella praeacuta]|uniref:hypothetical protein n=1 Tax=Tissierella praeacuta TaxID=43131 RepID=UPI00333EFE26
MNKLRGKIKILYLCIVLIFMIYLYFTPNIDNRRSLEHIKNVKKIEVYEFEDISKFNNNNKLLLEINCMDSLSIINKMFFSSHTYQGKIFEKDIEYKYALKVFTEDNYYLMFLFLGETYKNNFISFYGYDVWYFIEDYSSIIEFKRILDII